MAFSPSSRGRLTDRDVGRFPDCTLFHRLARAVCHAGCLPRKELYEAWEMARRVRRLFRGGRIVDLGAGHGLLAQAMLILDDSSTTALVVDKTWPRSSARLHRRWSRRGPACLNAWRSWSAGSRTSTFIPPTSSCRATPAGALTDSGARTSGRRARARGGPAVLSRSANLRCRRASGWVDGPIAD